MSSSRKALLVTGLWIGGLLGVAQVLTGFSHWIVVAVIPVVGIALAAVFPEDGEA